MPSQAANDDAIPTARQAEAPITNRRFVALVRAGLAAAGHRDIAIERAWIDEDTPGQPFLLNVPVGAELSVPLTPRDAFLRTEDVAHAAEHVDHFVKALITLRRAEGMLTKYARDVRRAAAKAIVNARAEGLDILLEDVGFKATCAWHLTGSSWKDAAYHILADVKVRHTSFYLQPVTSSVYVEEPGDVAKGLADIIGDERERMARVAYLEGLGADLIVDAITLDLLRAHVDDVPQCLRDAWRRQHVAIPVHHDGYETSLSLVTSDGLVRSGIQLTEAYWNGEMVWLLGDAVDNGIDVLGRTLAGKVNHPALAGRKVVHIDARATDRGRPATYHLDRSEQFLFDADTGRIWPLTTSMAA